MGSTATAADGRRGVREGLTLGLRKVPEIPVATLAYRQKSGNMHVWPARLIEERVMDPGSQ